MTSTVLACGTQCHAKVWFLELHQGTERVRYEVCYQEAGAHTPLYIRLVQDHCAEPQVNPLFLRLLCGPIGFTAEMYHV